MREIPVTAGDGVTLWAARQGTGPLPVVFCHGGPGLWDTLGDMAELLTETATATVHRWDQRGCGRSQRAGAEPHTMARYVADLDAVRASFGLDRVLLLGHSWGARLALEYALGHPERVAGLVYVSGTGIDAPGTWHPAYESGFRAGLGEHLPRWSELRELRESRDSHGRLTAAEEREMCVLQWSADFAFADRRRAIAAAERMATPFLGVNIEANAALNAEERAVTGTPALRRRCARLAVPVLIVDGALDHRPRTAVDSLAAALPRARRVTLPAGGHMPWAEEPEAFRDAVAEFLTRPVL